MMKNCEWCGKEFEMTKDRIKRNQRFCSTSCSAKWRNKEYGPNKPCKEKREQAKINMKKLWENDTFRKNNHIRMTENNPSKNIEVKNKIVNSIKNGVGYSNNFNNCGNGKMSYAESIAESILERYGFIYNYAISTKDIRNAFPEKRFAKNYKPDFINLKLKIAIEIDGTNHKSKNGIILDNKKEECLKYYGINIIRFDNEFVINNKAEFEKEIQLICQLNY